MLDINKLKNTWYFKEHILEKWDVLFNEWDLDNNIYIVLVWELSVEKFTTKNKNETKILAYLKKDDVFWEAALNDNLPKWVNIISRTKSLLLSIDAEKLVNIFAVKYKQEAFSLLKYIIFLSNKRLSEANYLITSTYTISKEIIELNEITNKTIFSLIEKLKQSIKINDIIYYEVNPVMENYITMKYDTRIPWKMLNEVIELTDNKLNLLDLQLEWYHNFTQKLSIWNNNLWYLVFLKKDNNFDDTDKKVIATTSTSIAWLIKQKQLLDEQRDKEYMQD